MKCEMMEEFEAWAKIHGFDLSWDAKRGDYSSTSTMLAWFAWLDYNE